MSKVILGGGISGLSAAHYLVKKFPSENILLLEALNRSGGWIKSNKHDGYIFEQGPRTIRPYGVKGKNTLKLIEDIGLQDQVQFIPKSHPVALNRMVYVNGALHKLPTSFSSLFVKNPPFSKPLVQYLVKEFRQSPKIIKDESIYDFVQRRLGTEIADYGISPLICGICAGNAREISVKFLMENLFNNEQKYGSITRGLVTNAFKVSPKLQSPSTLLKRAKEEKWSVFFFKNGLESLPEQLQKFNIENKVEIKLNQKCIGIEFISNNVNLHMENEIIKTPHVISTLSAKKLSDVIVGHEDLKKLLKSIPFVTVCVINLHYKSELINSEGFGFLIPPIEKKPILGVIFDSCCFPCKGCTNLTVMMGGFWYKTYFGEKPTKEYMLEVALQQLENIMGIKQKPDSYEINILKDCIPQYIVGHNDTVSKIENYIKEKELPLSLCGTSYYGVGINDAIYSAKNAVENLKSE